MQFKKSENSNVRGEVNERWQEAEVTHKQIHLKHILKTSVLFPVYGVLFAISVCKMFKGRTSPLTIEQFRVVTLKLVIHVGSSFFWFCSASKREQHASHLSIS